MGQQKMHHDEWRPIEIGHLSDSCDLKMILYYIMAIKMSFNSKFTDCWIWENLFFWHKMQHADEVILTLYIHLNSSSCRCPNGVIGGTRIWSWVLPLYGRYCIFGFIKKDIIVIACIEPFPCDTGVGVSSSNFTFQNSSFTFYYFVWITSDWYDIWFIYYKKIINVYSIILFKVTSSVHACVCVWKKIQAKINSIAFF